MSWPDCFVAHQHAEDDRAVGLAAQHLRAAKTIRHAAARGTLHSRMTISDSTSAPASVSM